MSFINKELLIQRASSLNSNTKAGRQYYGSIYHMIINMPIEDVEMVKHGEWINENRKDGEIYCSLCGATEKISDSQYKSPRCPLCGAHMIIEIK